MAVSGQVYLQILGRDESIGSDRGVRRPGGVASLSLGLSPSIALQTLQQNDLSQTQGQ